MKFFTVTGNIYKITGREKIYKNDVFMHNYALLGSIDHEYVEKLPKPHVTDMEKLAVEPKDFQIGQHLILQKITNLGEPVGKLHITAKIGKIKRGFF